MTLFKRNVNRTKQKINNTKKFLPGKHVIVSIPCHVPELVQKVEPFVATIPPRNSLLPVLAQAKVPREPYAIESVLITRGWMFSGNGQSENEHTQCKTRNGK